MSDWKEHAARVVAAVDPHLGVPVYLLTLAEAAEAFDGGEPMVDVDGLGGASFAAAMRGVLDAGPGWHGYGFACAVDPFLGVPEAAAVVLHEFAHWLDQFEQHDFWRGHELCRPSSEPLAVAPVPLVFSDAGPPPWKHHGPSWVRLCLHLAERCVSAGAWVYLNEIADPARYGLAPLGRYADALGDEPARLAELPMLDVARLDPPASFRDFAADDIERAERSLTTAAKAA